MRDSARLKAKPNCVGCEAGQLHQHLPGYEPDALTVKLQTKVVLIAPREEHGVTFNTSRCRNSGQRRLAMRSAHLAGARWLL